MALRSSLLALLAAVAGLAAGSAAASADEVASPFVVAMTPGAAEAEQDALAASVGATVREHYHGANAGFAAALTPTQVGALRAAASVRYVQPDVAITATGKRGPAPSPGELIPPGVRRVGGTVAGAPRQAAGVGVAVLDTGLSSSPDLNTRPEGVNCVSPGSAPADDNGHGTGIGGVIGARANGTGTVGVAPGTPLYAVKVLNRSNSGTLSQLLCGLDWVKANAARLNIRVVNMSIAAPGKDDGQCGDLDADALHRAVCSLTAAGILVVAAAGNEKADFANTSAASYHEALAVTAMSDTDGLPGGRGAAPSCVRGETDDAYATYSNFAVSDAAQRHTVAAPGTCIVTTGLKSATATYYGTSFAAPHAAAAAALCMNDGGVSGPCAALAPADVIALLRTDGLAGASGFRGDPLAPVTGRAYGPLVSAAGY
jgi:subtilisin